MDDTRCRSFFLEPTQRLHRRYEALRAFFVDRRSLPEIARDFDYGTLRNVIGTSTSNATTTICPLFTQPLYGRPGGKLSESGAKARLTRIAARAPVPLRAQVKGCGPTKLSSSRTGGCTRGIDLDS